MKADKLSKMISDLEIANRNLHLISVESDLDEKSGRRLGEAYELIKNVLVGLSEEEVVMEIYNYSDDICEEQTEEIDI